MKFTASPSSPASRCSWTKASERCRTDCHLALGGVEDAAAAGSSTLEGRAEALEALQGQQQSHAAPGRGAELATQALELAHCREVQRQRGSPQSKRGHVRVKQKHWKLSLEETGFCYSSVQAQAE